MSGLSSDRETGYYRERAKESSSNRQLGVGFVIAVLLEEWMAVEVGNVLLRAGLHFNSINPLLPLLSNPEQTFGLHDNSQLSLFTCLPLPNSQLLINTSLIRCSYSESILSTFSSQFGRMKADLRQGKHIHYISTHPLRTLPVARELDSSNR